MGRRATHHDLKKQRPLRYIIWNNSLFVIGLSNIYLCLTLILAAYNIPLNILKITKTNRKWWERILWWEIRRIPYNIIMYFVGLLSFYIGYITIPLIYIMIALGLNVIYTFGWIIELLFVSKLKNENRKIKYPQHTFISYLTLSALFVLGVAILLWH